MIVLASKLEDKIVTYVLQLLSNLEFFPIFPTTERRGDVSFQML
jgi:hypothetical protein